VNRKLQKFRESETLPDSIRERPHLESRAVIGQERDSRLPGEQVDFQFSFR
jgi:hypothetical protein